MLVWELSFSEWLVLAEAWWIMFGFHLALGWVSFERLNQWRPPGAKEFSNSSSPLVFAERLKGLVEMSSRLHLLPSTCLVKALTLRWLLGRHAIPAQVRIGAHKTCAGIHAHAWVEVNGQPIAEAEDIAQRFKVLN